MIRSDLGRKGQNTLQGGRFRQENVLFIGYILVHFGGNFFFISCNILMNI
jgi:hypothetical protein